MRCWPLSDFSLSGASDVAHVNIVKVSFICEQANDLKVAGCPSES